MTYEFYIDVFWLQNLVMDLGALLLVAVVRKYRASWRFIIAAAVSDTAACLFILALPYAAAVLLTHILCNPCMIWWAYGGKKIVWRDVWPNLALMYLAVFAEGGIVAWSRQYLEGNAAKYAAAAAYLSVLLFLLWRQKQKRAQSHEYEVELHIRTNDSTQPEKILNLLAYYDSGNLLTDPYTNRPVSVVSGQLVRAYVRYGELAVRLIPYQSLGSSGGFLEAVTVEKMIVQAEGQKLIAEHAVIGLSDAALFAGKKYNMLLHAAVLEENTCI